MSTPRFARLRTALATLTSNFYLFFGTLSIGMVGVLVSVVPPRGDWTLVFSKIWARCWLASSGIRVAGRFEERLDPRGTYLFLANHESYFDIPAVLATVPVQLRFAAKSGLFKIPVFGWAIRAGGLIPVDRDDKGSAQKVFALARKRLAEGKSVLFFPEGGRSEDGRLQPFERGGFLIALKAGVPVVPVGIQGTFEVQRIRSLKVSPGPVTVHYGRPIDPGQFGVRGRAELERLVREQIIELGGD